jgi:hypothetical protein
MAATVVLVPVDSSLFSEVALRSAETVVGATERRIRLFQ